MRIEELGAKEGVTFADCKLDRKKYAEALTDIISGFDNGGVIALNNKWGTGKTTFVKMWQQYLEDNQYQTIYFNAWENDFEDYALAALISELTEKIKGGKYIDDVIKFGSKLMLRLGSATLTSLTDKYLGEGYSKEVLKAFQEESEKILSKEIEQYNEKKNTIKEFRNALANSVSDKAQNKEKKTNIIFFVDELDRCRPNYAVKLLETIKHLFTVPNIIFVLSIDKEQLGYAIQGVYGSSKIDSDEYLRRFIDVEYSLPKINTENFIKLLLKETGVIDCFQKGNKVRETLNDFFPLFFRNNTLRQIEKAVVNLKLIIKSDHKNATEDTYKLLIFLMYFKINFPKRYNELKSSQIQITDFNSFFYDYFLEDHHLKIDQTLMAEIEGLLFMSYDSGLSGEVIYDKNQDKVLFESKINNKVFQLTVLDKFRYRGTNTYVKILMNYIELIPM